MLLNIISQMLVPCSQATSVEVGGARSWFRKITSTEHTTNVGSVLGDMLIRKDWIECEEPQLRPRCQMTAVTAETFDDEASHSPAPGSTSATTVAASSEEQSATGGETTAPIVAQGHECSRGSTDTPSQLSATTGSRDTGHGRAPELCHSELCSPFCLTNSGR